MAISPIQNGPNASPFSSQKGIAKSRAQGLAQVPDRLIERHPPVYPENPPSLFKKFLFEPLFEAVKFLLRGLFRLVDFLRRSAFEEKEALSSPHQKDLFLEHLRKAPLPEKLLRQFTKLYSLEEQERIYLTIGHAHQTKDSWKELFWDRSKEENIALGRRLVRENPFLLRNYL